MQKDIKKWCNGYICVQIDDTLSERFINLCKNKSIQIWDVHKVDKHVSFYIMASDYINLKYIVKKVSTVPKITSKIGLPFLMFKYRKRQAFIIGFMLSLFVLYISSLFVWDIQILGQSYHTESAIEKYLETIDVYNGMKIKNVKCRYIEDSIRKEYNDIGWVSAQISGTRLIIQVEENQMTKKESNDNIEGHLIAEYDGVIYSTFVRKGTLKTKPGESVKKGDIVIYGVVSVMDDNGVCIKEEKCRADGDVYIKRNINYSDEIPLVYMKKIYSEKKRWEIGVTFNKNYYIFLKNLKKFDSYDIIENVHNINVIDNFVLPIKVHLKEYRQYDVENRQYSEKQIISILNKRFERYCERLIQDNIKILNDNTNISFENDRAYCKGELVIVDKAKGFKTISENQLVIEDMRETDKITEY